MKKLMILLAAVCLLLAGCGKATGDASADKEQPGAASVETEAAQGNSDSSAQENSDSSVQENSDSSAQEQVPAVTVSPLPDSTMENLTDAILAVSLEEGGAYVDDTGKMQMDLKIFTYDKYDMAEISAMKVGDIIVTHAGEVKVTSLERSAGGILYVNGGLEEGGFDLVTDGSGFFFETGFDDEKNWYQVGEATIRVSADFEGCDQAYPDQGDVILYPGSFLIGEVKDYNFTPYNTTVRVEEGQIVEMTRRYVP